MNFKNITFFVTAITVVLTGFIGCYDDPASFGDLPPKTTEMTDSHVRNRLNVQVDIVTAMSVVKIQIPNAILVNRAA